MKRRRLLFLAVPLALLVFVIALIGIPGGGGSDGEPAQGPTEADLQAERERKLALKRTREDRAIQRVLRYTTFMRAGGGTKRQVALTFDDGPGPSTDEILDILRRTRTPATFFVTGVGIPDHGESLQRAAEEGHTIANHTQNHPDMGALDAAGQELEIATQEEAVESVGVDQHNLFRPPYRAFNQATFEVLAARNSLMVLWDVDTQDYASPDPNGMAQQVLSEAKPGSIILMHDGPGERSSTVQALPEMIRGLRRMNLQPVTIPQMLANDPPAPGERYPEGL